MCLFHMEALQFVTAEGDTMCNLTNICLSARGCTVGCDSHSIGGSSFTPSTYPHILSSYSASFPPSHLATHHCPTKRWQLVTNGLHCTLRVSCPRRQWQTQGSEEVQRRRKGAGSPRSSRAPGTGGWKSIQIRPLIGHDSTRAVECGNPLSTTHSRFGWWREREQRRAKGRGRGKETLFHIIATRAVPFKTYSFQTVSCSMSEWLKSLAAGRMGYVSKIHNWFGMTAFQWNDSAASALNCNPDIWRYQDWYHTHRIAFNNNGWSEPIEQS